MLQLKEEVVEPKFVSAALYCTVQLQAQSTANKYRLINRHIQGYMTLRMQPALAKTESACKSSRREHIQIVCSRRWSQKVNSGCKKQRLNLLKK